MTDATRSAASVQLRTLLRSAAARRMLTPSLTVIAPLPSTSQRSSQTLERSAAARSACTPSVTVTLPSPFASPQTAPAGGAKPATSAATRSASRSFRVPDRRRTRIVSRRRE
jgi:hypothetical protein